MKVVCNIFLVCLLISCETKTSPEKDRIHFSDKDSVVLGPQVIPSLNQSKLFTLSKSEVNELYEILSDTIERSNFEFHDGGKVHFSDLSKQIVPFYDKNSEKRIIIQTFCGKFTPYLEKNLLVISDGGPCFISAELDWNSKKVISLSANGYE